MGRSKRREGHRVEPPGVGHDARVGGEHAVDIGVDLAHVGLQCRGDGDGRGVGTATTQRGDVPGVLADALEPGDQHDLAVVERVAQPARGDVDDLGVAVRPGGDDAGLRSGERPGLRAEGLDGHRHQRVRDALTGGQQHVEFARRRRRRHLLGQVEKFVGGVAHRRDDHDNVVAGLLRLDDALGHTADAIGVSHRGSAVLLYDERHKKTFPVRGEIT